jgi:hypothetical protein
MHRRRVLGSLLVLPVLLTACKSEPGPPAAAPASAPRPEPPDPAVLEAEANALAALPIKVDRELGPDLQLVGLSVAARPDGQSWVVTLHSKVAHKRAPRPQIWLHAYPQGSQEYFIVDPNGGFQSAEAGRVVKDPFLLKKPGAFNLYAGIMGADGSYGPAVGLGWFGVGDPDTKEYHEAYRFLQEADDARALVMLEQARRDYPHAKLP